MSEIIRCASCKYFSIDLSKSVAGSCSHINALPFPSPSDYCSFAEKKIGGGGLDPEQQKLLLERIHKERFGR